MRLVKTNTPKPRLEDFTDQASRPPYAIVSHRWQQPEVTYHDLQKTDFSSDAEGKRRSWNKLMNARRVAYGLGFSYIWLDSCCVDQKSSAELTESINSMYAWYEEAEVCLAYLADDHSLNRHSFARSEWHKRGWTLQELIAPTEVLFYLSDWSLRGYRSEMADEISAATRIDANVLQRQPWFTLSDYSAAKILAWAAGRRTSKPEDRAYSLFGLFGVNLPVLYGEGETKAFWRLQMEIFRCTSDHSLFVWEVPLTMATSEEGRYDLFSTRPQGNAVGLTNYDLLAPSIECFRKSAVFSKSSYEWHFSMNSRVHRVLNVFDPVNIQRINRPYSADAHGMVVQLLLQREATAVKRDRGESWFLVPACQIDNDSDSIVVIPITTSSSGHVERQWFYEVRPRRATIRLHQMDVYLTAPRSHRPNLHNTPRLRVTDQTELVANIHDTDLIAAGFTCAWKSTDASVVSNGSWTFRTLLDRVGSGLWTARYSHQDYELPLSVGFGIVQQGGYLFPQLLLHNSEEPGRMVHGFRSELLTYTEISTKMDISYITSAALLRKLNATRRTGDVDWSTDPPFKTIIVVRQAKGSISMLDGSSSVHQRIDVSLSLHVRNRDAQQSRKLATRGVGPADERRHNDLRGMVDRGLSPDDIV